MSSKCIFDKVYDVEKETLDAEKKMENKPMVKSNLKRKFHAAFEDAETKKIDAKYKLTNTREEFVTKGGETGLTFINSILEQKRLIEVLTTMQAEIKSEYKLMFDEEMKPIEL